MPKSKSRFVLVILALIAIAALAIIGHIYFTEEQTLSIEQSYQQHLVDGSRPYPVVCNVHGERLRKDTVRIYYGSGESRSNDSEKYPYSNKWVGGGCIPSQYRYVAVMYCGVCREAETEWQAMNKE